MHILDAYRVLRYVMDLKYTGSEIPADLLTDDACGPPLRAYLALTQLQIGADLTPEDRVYNRYLWYLRFAQAYHAAFGDDAGIDQQALQILEHADCDIDWSVVERLGEEALQPYCC